MLHVNVSIDRERVIGTLDPNIFGQYLEHVQPEDQCIYGAIVDEHPPASGEPGYRMDVVEALRELDVPIVRWPGGCYADFYHWEDGVGPRAERPVRRNWHWGGLESNRFGTDEFLHWCAMIGADPYLNVNFGTGTLDEALRWCDYCNGDERSDDVARRIANGRTDPWNVTTWGLGNEQWGPWEAGHLAAPQYAEKLRNWAQFFRKYDPSLRLLGIGSPAANDPDWDVDVLGVAGGLIDYLTLHIYGHSFIDDPNDYDATVHFPIYVEERLRRMAGVIDAAGHGPTADHPIRISVDEWNIRHLTRDQDTGKTELHRRSPRRMQDTLAAAGALHAMARHADHVGMANYVFLLNGNGVLLVGPDGIVRTPLFHLFALYRRSLLPTVLDARVDAPAADGAVREERQDTTENRLIPYVDVIATVDDDPSNLSLAIVNRHRTERATVDVASATVANRGVATVTTITHDDPRAANTFQAPDIVCPDVTVGAWDGQVTVKPMSVTVVAVRSHASTG